MLAEDFLKQEYSYNTRQKLLSSLSIAYDEANNIKLSNPGFTTKKGEETLIPIRNLLAETQIKQNIDSRFLLNLEYHECKNYAQNCNHFEFISKNAIMTVSRVNEKEKLPRGAIYRENLSLNNGQLSLFDNENDESNDKKHILLTHGCKENKLSFAILGVPTADGKAWAYSIDLLNEPYIISDNTEDEFPTNVYKIKKNITNVKDGN